jgi:anti-sigma regulatory factor (Ser/Thr protein kinase)
VAGMQARRGSGRVLLVERWFRSDDLALLRALVSSHAQRAGVPEDQAELLVVVANELATNAVIHGGFEGRLRLWREPDHIVCEVVDAGPGIASPDTAGILRPAQLSTSGRGLWLVRRFADDVEIDSRPGWTRVAARLPLRTRRAVRA